MKLENLDHARAVFSRADAEDRAKRQRIFFDRIAHRQRRPEGRHDRAFSYIVADGELTPDDQAPVAEYLKHLDVEAISLVDKTLGPNEVWNLGKSTNPVVINLGTLTMEPGSRIEIFNTILSFTVENVIRNGSTGLTAGSENYDFGIFGVKPEPPAATATGGTGGVGNGGQEGTCKCSGTEPDNNGTKGEQGGQGGQGSPGTTGERGHRSATVWSSSAWPSG